LSSESPVNESPTGPERVLSADADPGDSVAIYPCCPPELFNGLRMDPGLGNFAHYTSIIQRLDAFQEIAGRKDGRVTLAIREERIVIGYVACWYPDQTERWSKLGELMYELAAIEVSRNFRHLRLGGRMIGALLGDPFFEEKIAYMNGFSWHWDLDGTGLTMSQYRRVMIRLLSGFGFQEVYTNEPNIALREENLFMARIGTKVSVEEQGRFRNLRFGIVDRS
jgi:acetoin utilization protein AcuA